MDIELAKQQLQRIEEENFKFKQERQKDEVLDKLALKDKLQLKEFKIYRREFEKRQEWAVFYVLDKYTDFDKEYKAVLFKEYLDQFYSGKIKSFAEYCKVNDIKIKWAGVCWPWGRNE